MISFKQSLQNQNSHCPGTSLQGNLFFYGSFIVGHMIIFHALRTQKYKICSSENRSKLYKVHWLKPGEGRNYTPSIAFRHLPPSSARIGYATERALFISAQLSTDAVSSLRKVWVLLRLWKEHIAFKQPCKHETHPLRVK